MTGEHLSVILKQASAKADKEGWDTLPEGATITLYLAHDGASLTIPRIQAIKGEGELVFARSAKRELFCLAKSDLFAVAVDGGEKVPERRAGFG